MRAVENTYLVASLVWWILTGCGFRNVTVGPFQLGCHWAADLLGYGYRREGAKWYPHRSVALACVLLRLPTFRMNADLATRRLARLWDHSMQKSQNMRVAVLEVGHAYNGTLWYGNVLLALQAVLSWADET